MPALLELVDVRPDWMNALGVALTRPPGVPERRAGEDPFADPTATERPRRVSDDLAWLRQAIDEPAENGLRTLDGTAAVAAWESHEPDSISRLNRLAERGILQAAGFLLHDADVPAQLE